MTLYLDTSALVKLYVEEPRSADVAHCVETAPRVATVLVTYAEARATFARLRRDRRISATELRRLVADLDADWRRLTVVDLPELLVRRAGHLAERHALRAYDAIQLGAALKLRDTGMNVTFGCFDDQLALAARRERLVDVFAAP